MNGFVLMCRNVIKVRTVMSLLCTGRLLLIGSVFSPGFSFGSVFSPVSNEFRFRCPSVSFGNGRFLGNDGLVNNGLWNNCLMELGFVNCNDVNWDFVTMEDFEIDDDMEDFEYVDDDVVISDEDVIGEVISLGSLANDGRFPRSQFLNNDALLISGISRWSKFKSSLISGFSNRFKSSLISFIIVVTSGSFFYVIIFNVSSNPGLFIFLLLLFLSTLIFIYIN